MTIVDRNNVAKFICFVLTGSRLLLKWKGHIHVYRILHGKSVYVAIMYKLAV